MSSMQLVSLARRSFEELHATHVAAFADYPVPAIPDRAAFADLLEARGGALEHSFGAVVDGELVGYVVNALDPARRLGYDVVTGLVPEHRGNGLARQLMEASARHLAAQGCPRYRLEVLVGNERAERLYAGVGFEVRRELVGLDLARAPAAADAPAALAWSALEEGDLDWAFAQLGYEPSWQNDRKSLGRSLARLVGRIGTLEDEPVAAGLVHPTHGSVPLLAVTPELRGRGIGGALLAELAAHAPSPLRFVNLVPGAGDRGIAWLERRGARVAWHQHELERSHGAVPSGT